MKILLIDDEPVSNYIVTRLLAGTTGLEIVDYTEPIEVFNDLAAINPDVIFLDLSMPDMSGWDFLDMMAANGLQHKVYILSSSISAVDIAKAKNYTNVIKCLAKPVTKEQLKQCLEAL
jgi:CheY-like chemotaxis protein